MRMSTRRALAGTALALLAWAPAAGAVQAQSGPGILVFAAASLSEALDANVRRFESQGGGSLVVSYAASSALARQVERGAPAEIFISADLDWMDFLDKRGLVQRGTRVSLLSNRLVLIVPAHSKASVAIAPRFPLAGLLGDGRLAMADPDSVPAGKYARAALEALGIWRDVSGKIARAENVRAALALVARGESPFGIVYRTDAAAEPRVHVAGEFDPALHPPIVYPAAILTGSRSSTATAFLAFLRSPAARTVWTRHGFQPME